MKFTNATGQTASYLLSTWKTSPYLDKAASPPNGLFFGEGAAMAPDADDDVSSSWSSDSEDILDIPEMDLSEKMGSSSDEN
mmetsp:Transcript_6133/g.9841  ORF Transcript_6133/g.9841 Transcript_6133/m.9841 type:complete len:81 (+) Transcript_6133:18-260(+)